MRDQVDKALVERAQSGDPSAIGELFSRYWRAARAAAFGVTGEFASAEDAAAEGFQKAIAGLNSLRDANRFGPWLRTIVVRKARLGLRSRRRTATDAAIDDLPDSNEMPDHLLERLELGALIQQSVRNLPPRLREAVSLFYFEGYDTEDAARFLDIPDGTFRRRLHEGRRSLRSAVEQVLQGSRPMNEERESRIEKLRRLMETAREGEAEPLYQVFRESLALRPPPRDLIDSFLQRHEASGSEAADAQGFTERAREIARQFAGPSVRSSDLIHPVGSVAAAIRKALPDFQEWNFDVGEAAAQFFTFTAPHRERIEALLPPGFAIGRPGAFVRATQALVFTSENDSVRTTYQHLQDSDAPETFRAGLNSVRLSDVLDLTWMVAGPLELRSVQELLERLTATVLPGTPIRVVPYDEPRYRSALRLLFDNQSMAAANGGVLTAWHGRPQDVDAAHIRIFLEPWATLKSGQVVELQRLPGKPA